MLAPAMADRGVYYGWIAALVGFLLATSAAMDIPGVLLLPLRNEFGWDGIISFPPSRSLRDGLPVRGGLDGAATACASRSA
jgi:hypothetical protein